MAPDKTLKTTCNRDCPDSCGVLATVRGGRVVKHRGDPDHPITRGSLCLRGNRYLKRLYSGERVLHPMRRTRGGAWERLAWDDALDLAADELRRARDAGGPEAVAVISYSGIKGQVARLLQRAFWAHFGGGTFISGGTSVEAAIEAQVADLGQAGAHSMEDLANAAGLVVWGKNIDVTRPHAWRFVNEAREAGAPLHVIDPVRCATARKADRHHQLRPGSDPWLALGIGRLLLEAGAGAIDHDFVREHTVGLEGYRALVTSVSLGQVSEATDLPPARIEELAELYAGTRPLATLIGLGPAYWPGAGATVRLIDALAAISGNLGLPGGGAHTDSSAGYTGMNHKLPGDPPEQFRRELPLPRLGAELLAATSPAPRVGWISGANPAATCPDTATVDRALAGLDFLVVVDQFLTASAAHADLFLPCTTYLEMEDLVVAYGHNWLGVDQAVIPPEGEARSDAAIYQGLARRLGFGEILAGAPAEWADRILGSLASEHGVTFERLRAGAALNPLAPSVPFADGRFSTASGKVELVGELPPLPRPDLSGGRLHLVATKTLKMVNAQINPEDLPGEPVARLHPDALTARGLAHGQLARVSSPVGQVVARLAADETLRRDMLLFNPAAWRGDLQGVNQLREALVTDLGTGAAMHATLVTVEALEPPAG